jgi:hypothetical protein
MTKIVLDVKLIRAAATDAGNRYMRKHPNEQPDGTNAWTRNALAAATTEFHRLCKLAGLNPYCLPKGL